MPRADRLSPAAVAMLREEKHLAVVSTLMPDGSIQSTPTWVDAEPDGTHVLINTVATHMKVGNVDRDPRVTVAVLDAASPFRNLVVRGTVVEKRGHDAGAADHIHALAKRYMGRDRYPLRDGEERVILRIAPTHVLERGIDGDRAARWQT
jgi:PPOX class probable F420-dependent enzyme